MNVDKRNLNEVDIEVFNEIEKEKKRQDEHIELIASENFVSKAVMQAMGSCFTNKYAEGYPNARYYNGCENIDVVETLAIERAKKLFNAEHVNVQPHSGSNANLAVFLSCLNAGDTFMGMSLTAGGHLSHGAPFNISGKFFKCVPYGLNLETELLDYDEIEKLAIEHKPKLIIAGGSAYSRIIDFKKFREIADKVGALLMVDMAHIAGLVATGLHPSPIPYADFVTTTTHKTLRGPRGGMILCKEKHAKAIDKAVFPCLQGGPLEHVIAGKAVMLKEALAPEFKTYQEQVVKNAKILGEELLKYGFKLVSGGTDNHLLLVDLTPFNTNGKDVANLLHKANITCNKNGIPNEKQPLNITSGIRLGTPAITTRGMKENEMKEIASFIFEIVKNGENAVESVKNKVLNLTKKF